MARTHTWQRTARLYREKGFHVCKTEIYVAGRRRDLLGFIDGFALGPGVVIALQACGTDFQEHFRKITIEVAEYARRWLDTGEPIHLVGWRKLALEGWTPRIREIEISDLQI